MKYILLFLLIIPSFFISSINAQFKMGNWGELPPLYHLKFRINRVEFEKEIKNALYTQRADGIYLLVYCTLVNTDKEQSTIYNSMFSVINSNGYKYLSSSEGTTAQILNSEAQSFLMKDLPPNIPKDVILCFEVPYSVDNYTLRITYDNGKYDYNSVDLWYNEIPEEIYEFTQLFNKSLLEKDAKLLSSLLCKEFFFEESGGNHPPNDSFIRSEKERLEYSKNYVNLEIPQIIDKRCDFLISDKEINEKITKLLSKFKIKLKYEKLIYISTNGDYIRAGYYLIKRNGHWEILEIYR